MRSTPFLAALLLALAGCEAPLGLGSTRLEDRQAAGGVELSLAASRTEITPGDTVRLVATVRNRGSAPVRIVFPSGCQVLFYVENAAGKVVYPDGGEWGCTMALTEMRLEAGEAREVVHGWTGRVSEYVPGSGVTWRPVPAGPYTVHAALEGKIGTEPLRLRTARSVVAVR